MAKKLMLREIDNGEIARMREKGATLEKIARKYGASRETIRHFLRKHYPESLYPKDLLTTHKAAQEAGVSVFTFKNRAKKLGLKPTASSPRRLFWSLDSVERIALSRRCRICGGLLPKGHWRVCNNEKCIKEAGVYRKQNFQAQVAQREVSKRQPMKHSEIRKAKVV